jgi:HlyB family type I secretion system ABC transporter
VDARPSLPPDLPLLRFLPLDARRLVASSFVPVRFPFGAPIVREGEEADSYYVLVSGRARVIKRTEGGEEVALNVLRPGDSFGEMALLEHGKRSFTVRASADVEALRLDKSIFHALVENHAELRSYLELQAKHRSLANFFRLYTAFARLPADEIAILLSELEPVEIGPGEIVVREGEPAGPMYVVEEGRLRTFVERGGRRRYLGYLRRGDFFGEMAMFRGTPRAATVEAVAPCRLLRLTPATFRRLVEGSAHFRERIDDRIRQYDEPQDARVPLDFAEELLPAEVAVHDDVGPDQVDGARTSTAAGPFASPEGLFVKKGARLRAVPFVRQIDEMDCGAACLAMICRHFGRSVSMARIRQLANTGASGTNLKALRHAAVDLGLAARAVRAPKDQLDQMPLPAIVHWEGNHWVVLVDVGERAVRIADPALGPRRVERGEFERRWTGYAALFDYTEAFERAPEARVSALWLAGFLRPHARLLGQAAALAAVVSLIELSFPVFTQLVVDKVLVDRNVELLRILVLSMAVMLVVLALASVVQRYLLSFVAVRFDAAALDHLMQRLLSLPLTYFGARRTGDIQRRLQGMRQIREFLVQNGVQVLTAGAQLAAALILMSAYSPLLTAVFLATAPAYALLMRFSSRRLRPIFDDLEEGYGRYASQQIDAIKGIETVKAMGAESALRELMLGQFHGMARRQFNADFTVMCYEAAIRALAFVSTISFLWVGAKQAMAGALTVGGLLAFNSLVAMANAPIALGLSLWDRLQAVRVLLDRLNDVFEAEPEQGADRSRLVPVPTLEGRIRFQNVVFRFGGPESAKILDGITFEVPAGKRVAIVGRSGSGKTTLIKCLAGLLEPTEGTILYDGLDMRTLNYQHLRRKIGFVLQDNYLFNDTIARNIAFGEDEPDMDGVIWAARAASAHEFVERLPLGYETRVGESGIALSGGQRQRIAIARALYHRPPVLIFDEATSALDTESERAVKENIDDILERRTAFVIAHRLSTIRNSDVILVLERGKIAESGSHDELMERRGLYYYLCRQQIEA